MPRITKVYTRTGDDGTTALVGGGRVAKDSVRIEAYGTVDELSSAVGVALAADLDGRVAKPLVRIQNELFHLGAELATPAEGDGGASGPRIDKRHVEALEQLMDELGEQLEPLRNFVLPGGAPGAAHLHLARTVCRRAERLVVALAREAEVRPDALTYLNRLSDALFVLARYENHRQGAEDILWDSRA